MHLGPYVYHIANKEKWKMSIGNIFTIEPIIMMKNTNNIKMWNDGWTVVAPGIPSA